MWWSGRGGEGGKEEGVKIMSLCFVSYVVMSVKSNLPSTSFMLWTDCGKVLIRPPPLIVCLML